MIIDGKKEAQLLRDEIKKEILSIKSKNNKVPFIRRRGEVVKKLAALRLLRYCSHILCEKGFYLFLSQSSKPFKNSSATLFPNL